MRQKFTSLHFGRRDWICASPEAVNDACYFGHSRWSGGNERVRWDLGYSPDGNRSTGSDSCGTKPATENDIWGFSGASTWARGIIGALESAGGSFVYMHREGRKEGSQPYEYSSPVAVQVRKGVVPYKCKAEIPLGGRFAFPAPPNFRRCGLGCAARRPTPDSQAVLKKSRSRIEYERGRVWFSVRFGGGTDEEPGLASMWDEGSRIAIRFGAERI
ncbi:hypothetical protein FB451DRAFT_1175946 [Mycena latifolia]|nr:hypothetical protein FB451DRAFT_1175946 [Mycena latifolia]